MPVESASMGEIVAVTGIEDIMIGDTICAPDAVDPLPFVKITEPTVAMTFSVNDSPFRWRPARRRYGAGYRPYTAHSDRTRRS